MKLLNRVKPNIASLNKIKTKKSTSISNYHELYNFLESFKKDDTSVLISIILPMYNEENTIRSILEMLPKSKLISVGIFGVSPHKYYIITFIFFVMGVCFLISSVGLLKRKAWARKIFLLSILANFVLEIGWFVRDINYIIRHELSSINLTSLSEFLVVLSLTLVCFLYFNRTNVRMYLNPDNTNTNATQLRTSDE